MNEQPTPRDSKSSGRAWIQPGIGTVIILPLFIFIGVKGWFYRATPSDPELTHGRVVLLVNQNSGRCLTVKDGSTVTGTIIVQGPTPARAGASERWVLLRVRKGVFRLLNENSQKVAQIPAGNTERGAQVRLSQDERIQPNQHWAFERVGDNYFLRVKHSQLLLTIGQGSKDDGGLAIQWEHLPTVTDQHWKLQSLSK